MRVKATFKEIIITKYPKIWEGYGCEFQLNYITKRYTRVTVEGLHQKDKDNNDVGGVKIEYVNHFPLDLRANFPQLTTLSLKHCFLKSISRRELAGLKQLTTICFERADMLETLPNDLFHDLKNLTSVAFIFGALKYLDGNMFLPIISNKLKAIDLSCNDGISAAYFKEFSFRRSAISTYSIELFLKIINEGCRKPEPVTQVPTLQSLCEPVVSEILNLSNAKEIALLGHAYHCNFLKQQALDVILDC